MRREPGTVNRRGELEKAFSAARVPNAPYKLWWQLLRRCGNDTGEIADDKHAPLLSTMARQANQMSLRTAERALAWLIEHEWFRRYVTKDPSKVAGMLHIGRHSEATALCQGPGCAEPLANRRRDARYHSERCKKAAQRAAKQADAAVSIRDMSRLDAGHVPALKGTASDISRDKAQVNGHKAGRGPSREQQREGSRENRPANDLVHCQFCGQQGGGALGVIKHAGDCWAGAMWRIYERER